MGCGSSSLKGEKVGDLAGEGDGPPVRKVNTNFGEVDFSGGAAPDRRSTMAVAPDEHGRSPGHAHGPAGDVAPDMPMTPTKSKGDVDGGHLEPYHTIEEPAPGEQVVKKEDHPVEDVSPTAAVRAAETMDNPIKA